MKLGKSFKLLSKNFRNKNLVIEIKDLVDRFFLIRYS